MVKRKRVFLAPQVSAVERVPAPVRIIRSAYGPKRRVAQSFASEGRTKQSFQAECDINNIMARFMKTGVLSWLSKHEGSYGDVSSLDFQSAQDMIVRAKEMFAALPSKIRSRFDNEPAKFLAFMEDEDNRSESVRLGLRKAEKAPEAVVPEVPATPLPEGGVKAPEKAA